MITTTEHYHIIQDDEILGGKPIIKGTRIPVRAIVGYYKLGMTVEEILDGFPELTPAQVFDALSYYHDHKYEMEQEIEENKIQNLINQGKIKLGKKGRLLVDSEAE